MNSTDRRATYIGTGEYLNGIPARDLTEEEFTALSPEGKDAVKRSGLYELAADPSARQPAAEPAESDGQDLPAQAPAAKKGGSN